MALVSPPTPTLPLKGGGGRILFPSPLEGEGREGGATGSTIIVRTEELR